MTARSSWCAHALAAMLLVLAVVAPAAWSRDRASASLPAVALTDLPAEARSTLAIIRRGGPYPHDRDGVVFGNFERQLPPRERGYYREYTVRTPGVAHRGARRIVVGRGGELYYTDNHYQSFRRIVE